MPLRPNFVERQLIRAGVVPGIMLDLLMPINQFSAVLAASEAGLFEQLKEGPLGARELAARTGSAERGVEVLARALVGLGYLESRDGTYALTKAARRSLPIDELPAMAPFWSAAAMRFQDAGRAVREAPPGGIMGWQAVQSGEVARGYQAAMRWLASGLVDEVLRRVDPPSGAQRLLDVGGAHGLYTVAFCRKYPELRGTILDWPAGLESARATLAENPDVAQRIDLVESDFERDELPGGYDLALLGNIVHGLSPEGNRLLFGKLAAATTERGTVAIVDQLADTSGSQFARGVASLIGFNLFLAVGGQAYAYDELAGWLTGAGFSAVSRKGLRKAPGISVVVARKRD